MYKPEKEGHTARPPLSQRAVDKQPNSHHCFVCGLKNPNGLAMHFYNVGPGQVEANYSVPRSFEGYPGIVHGGIIAAMLDEVVGRVAMTEDPNHFLVTAKLELRYRAPVPVETELRLRGWLERDRGRLVAAAGEILLADGTVAVEAEATLVDKPDQAVEDDLLQSLGWRVYADDEDIQQA